MRPCPVCNLPDGFHDHKDVVVPPQNVLPKGWLQMLTKKQVSFTTWAENQKHE